MPSTPTRRIDFAKKDSLKNLSRDKPAKQVLVWDSGSRGALHVLLSPEGAITMRVCYDLRSRPGKPRYKTLGRWPDGEYRQDGKVYRCRDIREMRTLAGIIRKAAKDDDVDPSRPPVSTRFADVVASFIELYAKPNTRRWRDTELCFETYVLPRWRDLDIAQIRRTAIRELLDDIVARRLRHPGRASPSVG